MEEERDELADLPDRVDGSGVSGLLNPKLTTIDIRQVQNWTLRVILFQLWRLLVLVI